MIMIGWFYRFGLLTIMSVSTTGDRAMKNEAAKFTITVPEGHPEAGKKVEKAFEYQVCETEQEAQDTLKKKSTDAEGKPLDNGWTLKDLVNDKIKSNARSNAYQNALLPYRPSEVSEDVIRERAIRDLIRLGMP